MAVKQISVLAIHLPDELTVGLFSDKRINSVTLIDQNHPYTYASLPEAIPLILIWKPAFQETATLENLVAHLRLKYEKYCYIVLLDTDNHDRLNNLVLKWKIKANRLAIIDKVGWEKILRQALFQTRKLLKKT